MLACSSQVAYQISDGMLLAIISHIYMCCDTGIGTARKGQMTSVSECICCREINKVIAAANDIQHSGFNALKFVGSFKLHFTCRHHYDNHDI